MVMPNPGTTKPTGASHAGTPIRKPGGSFQGTAKPTGGSHPGTARPTGGSHPGNSRPTAGSHPGRPAPKKPSQPDLDVLELIDDKPRRKGNVPALLLGLGAILLGITGLCLSVLDMEGIGKLTCGLGLGMAVLGLLLAIVRFRGFGCPFVGTLTAGGALYAALVIPSNPAEKGSSQSTAVATADSSKRDTSSEPKTSAQTPPTTKKYIPPPPAEEWTDASKGFARVGDVRVRVTRVEIGQLVPPDKQLSIRLQIENGGLSKKVAYRGAADPASRTGDSAPRLLDSSGVMYQPISKGAPLPGQMAKTSIDPSKSVNDMLVFPPPPDGTRYLRLELPGALFGTTGSVKIQIPSSMIVKAATSTVKSDPKSIEKLRQSLRGPDRQAKLFAATQLGQIGPKAASAVPELIQVLKDPDPVLRAAAAEALGKIGPEANSAVSDLVALFADPDDNVAAKALEAVKRIEGAATK